MEIKVRTVEASRYVEVSIKEGSTTIDLGLVDKADGHGLALNLLDAVYELKEKLGLDLMLLDR